eukprot:1144187-Pelagomonas_calceolata.AAC.4
MRRSSACVYLWPKRWSDARAAAKEGCGSGRPKPDPGGLGPGAAWQRHQNWSKGLESGAQLRKLSSTAEPRAGGVTDATAHSASGLQLLVLLTWCMLLGMTHKILHACLHQQAWATLRCCRLHSRVRTSHAPATASRKALAAPSSVQAAEGATALKGARP